MSSLKTVMEEKQKRDTSLIGRLETELDCLRLKIEETNKTVEQTSQENRELQARLQKGPPDRGPEPGAAWRSGWPRR